MFSLTKSSKLYGSLAVAFVAISSGACAHVNQESLDTEMDRMRQEMMAGDEAVAQSLGTRIDDNAARTDALELRLQAVEGDLRTLQQDFDIFVERMDNSLRLHTPVHFNFDDDSVRPEDEEFLGRVSGILNERYPAAMVTVEGFTDPSGPAAYNLKLGQRRADSVREWLVSASALTADQIRAVSYGEDTSRLVRPEASGRSASAMANRRVVLVIDHEGTVMVETPVITDSGSN